MNAARLLRVEPEADRGRDLIYGAGGPRLAPARGVTYALVERISHGFSPKMEVKDPSGTKWDVKTGPEAQPEVLAGLALAGAVRRMRSKPSL